MGAPQYRIQIQKTLGADSWSNVYLTDDPNLLDAQDLSALLLTFEQHIHMDIVLFDFILISTFAPDDRVFRHLPINQPGLVGPNPYLPLYNTARLDLTTSSSDPARKYYRLPIDEGQQSNGLIVGGALATLTAAFNTYMVATSVLEHIVTNTGHTVVAGSFHAPVQMRQLHRKRKKKLVP